MSVPPSVRSANDAPAAMAAFSIARVSTARAVSTPISATISS